MPFLEPINNNTVSALIHTTDAYAENFLGLMILLIIFFVLLFRLKDYPLPQAFAASSFITMIVAILLRVILPIDLLMGLSIIIALISLAVLLVSQKQTRAI